MDWKTLLTGNRYARPYKSTEIRNAFQRDYDRIIFSNAFRRLQNKTQVFPLPGSQMVHNRLTHSLEVASVGRSIAMIIAKELETAHPEDREIFTSIDIVVSTTCLAHDMGNPPFGHSGEDSISHYFKNGNGKIFESMIEPCQWSDLIAFEGNANAFRLLTHQFSGRRQGGYSLTYATLASLIKYPYPSFNNGGRKKYNFFHSETDDFKKVMQQCGIPCLDEEHSVYARHPLSYIMEAADDICYLILDMEDAQKRDIISTDETENTFMAFFNTDNENDTLFFKHKDSVYNEVNDNNERISFLRAALINKLVNCSAKIFIDNYKQIMQGSFDGSLISHLPEFEKQALYSCRKMSCDKIYKHKSVVKVELTGFNVIGSLLDEFTNAVMSPETPYNKKLLSLIPEQFIIPRNSTTYNKLQSVIDFISNMTDLYAVQMYKDLRGIE